MTRNDSESGSGIDRRTVLRSGAVLAGASTVVGTVAADKPDKRTVDLVGAEREPPCRDEVLEAIQGKQRVTVDTTSDGNGGFHLNFHSHFDPLVKLEGQESGTVWTAQGSLNFEQNIRGPFPRTVHVTDQVTATAEGATETIYRHGEFHLTINARGDLSQFRFDVEWRCTR